MAEQTVAAAGSPERIGLGKRLGALLLDMVVLALVCLVLGVVLGGAGALLGKWDTLLDRPLADVLGGILITVYFLWEGLTGAAYGKRYLGIRIANENGTKASTGTLIIRCAIKTLGLILLMLGEICPIHALHSLGKLACAIVFIGCFFVLGKKRQALHDMLAKTAVFNSSDYR